MPKGEVLQVRSWDGVREAGSIGSSVYGRTGTFVSGSDWARCDDNMKEQADRAAATWLAEMNLDRRTEGNQSYRRAAGTRRSFMGGNEY